MTFFIIFFRGPVPNSGKILCEYLFAVLHTVHMHVALLLSAEMDIWLICGCVLCLVGWYI